MEPGLHTQREHLLPVRAAPKSRVRFTQGPHLPQCN